MSDGIRSRAGWVIACHRRTSHYKDERTHTGCPSMVWLPASPMKLLEPHEAPTVREQLARLPHGWTADLWSHDHRRVLRDDEQAVLVRPHYFCSDTCRAIGCGSCDDECRSHGWCDNEETHHAVESCRAWERSFEVSEEIARQIAASVITGSQT